MKTLLVSFFLLSSVSAMAQDLVCQQIGNDWQVYSTKRGQYLGSE